MPNNPKNSTNRRQFLKATAAATAGLPATVMAYNAAAMPPIISLLLDDLDPVTGSAVLEGEGTGDIVNFPDNTITLNQGRNLVEAFFSKFRSEFDRVGDTDHGFDDLTAVLPEAIEQEVTLTIRVTSPSNPTISVDTPSQTVMSDTTGLAVFDKVVFLEQFGRNSGFANHTFELRYSSRGFEDSVIIVELDLESAFLERGTIAIEATPIPPRSFASFFFNGADNVVENFYDKFRPDRQDELGGPSIAISRLSVELTPTPTSPINVSVAVEVIEGNQIGLDPNTANQTILTSEQRPEFAKVAFIPNDFGPAGSTNPITTNHTFRFTWSAEGYLPVSYDIVFDLESPVSPT